VFQKQETRRTGREGLKIYRIKLVEMKNTVTEELSELNSGLEVAGEKTRKKGQKNYLYGRSQRKKYIIYYIYNNIYHI